jgi:acetyl esterase
MLDPDVRKLLDTYFAAPAPAGPPDVAALRAAAEAAPAALGGDPEPVAHVRDRRVGHAKGAVPIRIYRPAADGPLPLVVFAHGGGWVTGSLDSHDRLCRMLANRLGSVVVAVDYRRAPEHPYPAALDDVEAAWHWCIEEARALHVDLARTAVAGDSSGGNLAAALALRVARRREARPTLQLLLYPALDASAALPSYERHAEGFNLTAAMMRWYWREYAREASPADPELSPLAAADVSVFPPTVIAVAQADVLRDDGLAFAARLRDAGVPVRVVDCAGMVHGFLRWTGAVPAARHWVDEIASAAQAFGGQ